MEEVVSLDPATAAPVWRAAVGNVDTEVDAARAAQAGWAARPLTVRIETMRRFANIVRARHEELTTLISRETGLPLWESRAEIDRTIAQVDLSIRGYAERTPQRRLEGELGARTGLRHKPLGVIGIITPFAAPASLPTGQALAALLAGNAVVLKPSEKTPATATFIASCFVEAGVPDGVIRLLIGGAGAGEALSQHHGVDAVFFTGQATNGLALSRQFADRPDRLLSLSLGGNNPVIAWSTGDIPAAAALIVQSAFGATGQRCTAARRLIVEMAAMARFSTRSGGFSTGSLSARPPKRRSPLWGR